MTAAINVIGRAARKRPSSGPQDAPTPRPFVIASVTAPEIDWDERLSLCDSYARVHELALAMLSMRDPLKRLQLFGSWCNMCDAPWAYRSIFADMLRKAIAQVGLIEALDPKERDWFRSLEPNVRVFRGCERGRVRGLHWSTDREVAEGFARGKRCRNEHPTLVRAIIPKQHILFLFLGRQEHEVVVDPRRLRQITTETIS